MGSAITEQVSVIIPAFNASKTILTCISSVLTQNQLPREILVVDDASKDGTADLVETIRNTPIEIRCIRIPTNSGSPATPRNIGMENAKCEVIAFLDADDIWEPFHLEVSLHTMREFGCSFVTSCAVLTDSDPQFLNECPPKGEEISLASLIWSNSVLCSSVVVDSRIFPDSLEFPRGFHIYEDYAQWLILATRSQLRSTGSRTVNYARSGIDRMSSRRTQPLTATWRTFCVARPHLDRFSIRWRFSFVAIALLSLLRIAVGTFSRKVRGVARFRDLTTR